MCANLKGEVLFRQGQITLPAVPVIDWRPKFRPNSTGDRTMMQKFLLLLAAGLVGLTAAAAPVGALTTGHRFLLADADRNGQVSRTEYDLSGDRWFNSVDGDGDRTITRKEITAWRRGLMGWCHWKRYYQRIVSVFDANRDDRISAAEYASAIRRYDPVTQSVVGSTWEQFRQTFAAPVAWHKHRREHKLLCREERKRARPFDLTRDGRVTRAEFDAVRTVNFLRLDRNEDGVISYKEARKGQTRLYRISEP